MEDLFLQSQRRNQDRAVQDARLEELRAGRTVQRLAEEPDDRAESSRKAERI